jgi:hypothetical protein
MACPAGYRDAQAVVVGGSTPVGFVPYNAGKFDRRISFGSKKRSADIGRVQNID